MRTGISNRQLTRESERGYCMIPIEFGDIGTNHYLYPTWSSIKQRCYNKENKDYHLYGARGIYLCPRWLYSFKNFVEDMGERPKGYSIDRINNDGPYSPQNCKWSSSFEQRKNQRIRSDNKSGEEGISIKGNLWRVVVTVDKKWTQVGTYYTKKEAIAAKQAFLKGLNFHKKESI